MLKSQLVHGEMGFSSLIGYSAFSITHHSYTVSTTILKQTGGAGVQTNDLLVSGRPSQPPEPQLRSFCWFTHLLNDFAAHRDVGSAEDVSHVSWNTQVIFFIWLGHLHTKYENPISNLVYLQYVQHKTSVVWIKILEGKSSKVDNTLPGSAFCSRLWNYSSLPERRRRQSAFLGKKIIFFKKAIMMRIRRVTQNHSVISSRQRHRDCDEEEAVSPAALSLTSLPTLLSMTVSVSPGCCSTSSPDCLRLANVSRWSTP